MENVEHLARRVDEERDRSEKAVRAAEYRAHLLLAHEYERRLIAATRNADINRHEPRAFPSLR